MYSNIIFLGGIHGVGKGKICLDICQKYDLKYLSASQIIKWEEISKKHNKEVKDINFTQSRLIQGLRQTVTPSEQYILDGHFCLFNKDGVPTKINSDVFQVIKPSAFCIKTEEIEVIADRLSRRDRKDYNISTLHKMQDLEIERASFLSKELKVPLFTITQDIPDSLIQHLK